MSNWTSLASRLRGCGQLPPTRWQKIQPVDNVQRWMATQTPCSAILKAPDGSVNFVSQSFRKNGVLSKGVKECRYVRRDDRHVSGYVSSGDGCNEGCEQCWLTQTGQTSTNKSTKQDYVDQLRTIVAHYKQEVDGGAKLAEWLYVNFMARGDALANPTVLFDYNSLYDAFEEIANEHNLSLRMNVSSIFPKSLRANPTLWRKGTNELDLLQVFGHPTQDHTGIDKSLGGIPGRPVHLFYSLYSMEEGFRRKVMPNALDPRIVLPSLAWFQRMTDQPIALHWAMIKGGNDDKKTLDNLVDAILDSGVWGKFNQVRFNGHPKSGMSEPEEGVRLEFFNRISEAMLQNARAANKFPSQTGRSKQVSIVGKEVLASCGTFPAPVESDGLDADGPTLRNDFSGQTFKLRRQG